MNKDFVSLALARKPQSITNHIPISFTFSSQHPKENIYIGLSTGIFFTSASLSNFKTGINIVVIKYVL